MTMTAEQKKLIIREARRESARRNYRNYVKSVHHGNFEHYAHTDLICDYLQRIVDGEQMHLMIEMPPRHGKSMTVTETFPSYFLMRNPTKRVITSAYSEGLARKFGRLNRNKFEEFSSDLFSLGLSADNNSTTDWGLADYNGGMIATGIGGSITGQGADCFPQGTMINTEIGKIDIKALHEMENKPRVVSYNHDKQVTELKHVIASKKKQSSNMGQMKTLRGYKCESTAEHLYYVVNKGYTRLKDLRHEDKLLINNKGYIFQDDFVDAFDYEKDTTVYDIQVADNNNFFANDLLVHNCMIIDDPIKNAKEAQSKTIRENIWDEWESTLSTRLHDGASVIVIMTRWHQDDFIGRLLEQSPYDWKRLRLPAIAEDDDDLLNREVGEPLCRELGFDEEWAELKKREVGSRTWASLYQQRPSPAQGTIFKREWVQYYDKVPPRYDDMLMSWDFTFKDSESSDYAVGQVWIKQGADFYLIDQIRAKMDFTQSVRAVESMKNKHPKCRKILIEDKANGPAIITTLKQKVSGIIPITPKESKVARAYAVTPFFEAGNVFVGKKVPSVDDFIDELTMFDNAVHDDTVDAMTQALNYFASKPTASVITGNAW